MTDESQGDQNIHADENSIAFGGISVGGNVGDIRIGHTIGFTSDQVSTLLTQISTTFQPRPFDGRCPYKGLDYFEEADADMFFGREKVVSDLVSRVQESRTLFITGPSGSGKSSLGRAGLIHALKQGDLPGSDKWLYATMKPGREPIATLARAVAGLVMSTNAEDEIRARAMNDETIFARWCEIALQDGRDKRVVLYIDQFEEVFTQVSKEEERIAFLDLLTHSASVENGRVTLLFSMRSDFIPNCATYPKLNAVLNRQFVQIGSMQQDELVSAIAQPALRVGLKIDPDLIAQIINDMHGEPGALPLMQFALKDLFDAQQEKGGLIALTLNDYLQRGGIHKALERHADKTFSQLSENEQELARSIFTGLIEIGRGTQDTRRTAVFQELVPASQQSADVEAIVQKLADARLITTDEVAGKDTVTISHEKLIDAWPWLKKLVNENRDVIALQNEISADAKEWDEHKRDPSYLYMGARLINVNEKLKSKELVLSGTAFEYIQSGQARQRRGRLTTIGAISTIIVLLILAVIVFSRQSAINAQNASNAQAASTFAIQQQETAQANAEEALKQANIARSQIFTIQVRSDPSAIQRNLLFSIEALRLVKDYSRSDRTLAEQSMRDSLAQVSGIPLAGHESGISTLAFSPDGNRLATGSDDTTIRLWDMNNLSEEPIVLNGHENSITALAFSPDGDWLATGSLDTTVRLWDMNNPSAEPIILKGHENSITALAFSPDGNWLATGSDEGTALLWDMHNPSAEPIFLKGHEGFIRTFAFSLDRHWLATASNSGPARLWDMRNPSAEPILLTGPEGTRDFTHYTLAFSPDGNWLASGNDDGVARLWDVNNLSAEPIVLKHEAPVSRLTFSPDGDWLATGSLDSQTVRLWDMNNLSAEPTVLKGPEAVSDNVLRYPLTFSLDGNWLATGSLDSRTVRLWDMNNPSAEPIILKGHESRVFTLAFSPDGKWLATGSGDNTPRLWDLNNSAAEPVVLKGHDVAAYALAFSPVGDWLATRSYSTTARLWDMNNPSAEPIVLKGPEELSEGSSYYTLAFSPDGDWLATGTYDGTVRLWDTNNPSAEPIVLMGHEGAIITLAFSPDGKWLATTDGLDVRLWNMHNPFAEPIVLKEYESYFSALAFSPDGHWLATGSHDTTVRLWDMNKPSGEAMVLNGDGSTLRSLAFSPDGNWLASAGSLDATVRLWDMHNPSTEPIILNGDGSKIMSLAFSPDGKWLATGSYDTTVSLWDMNDPSTEPIDLKGQDGPVSTLAFSPDGHWLATGSEYPIVRLWDMNDPSAEPIVLQGHESQIRTLAFSPDGNWLATGSDDTTVRLWSLNLSSLLEKGCQVVGRNFTRIEWTTYFRNEEYRQTCDQWPLEPELQVTPTPTP